jgi:hypothetical protein
MMELLPGDEVSFKCAFDKLHTGVIVDFISLNYIKVYEKSSMSFFTVNLKDLI